MLLSNMFSNRLNDLVDSSDKEDIISRHQNRNATTPQLPATGRDRVASHFELEEQKRDAKEDTSDVSYLYRGIIKCN